MSSFHASKAVLTRERAFEDAWITYMKDVRLYSIDDIARLTIVAAVRLANGSFSPDGGLGKPLAARTIRWRLSEVREQVVQEFISGPLNEMLYERHLELQHVMSMFAEEARVSEGKARLEALAGYLRTHESERKLLGLDRPQQIEVTHEVAQHDDPASTKLKKAMQAAQARRDEMLAEVNDEGDNA